MTLCLAAEGWLDNGKQCIAFCCDTSGERGGVVQELVGSDGAWKIREIGANVALLSGAETPVDQLLAVCHKTIANFGAQKSRDDSEVAIARFLEELRTHAGARKRALVEHWVQFHLGISFDYFVKHHREQFHPEHAKDIWRRIQDFNLEADIIICGFQDDDPVIARMDRYGKVFREHNYTAIGAGADIAYSFLAQRNWDDQPTMWQCVDYLCDAKQAVQQNRQVRPYTRISVLLPDTKIRGIQFASSEKPGVKLTVQSKASKPGFTGGLLEILVDKSGVALSNGRGLAVPEHEVSGDEERAIPQAAWSTTDEF